MSTIPPKRPATRPNGLYKDSYTVAQLSKRWQVSGRHIRRLLAIGELLFTRIGKPVRITAEEVMLFEHVNKTKSHPVIARH